MKMLNRLGQQKYIPFYKTRRNFFLLDTFKDSDVAQLPAVRHCVPGPGYFNVIDTGNKLSIVNHKRRSTGNTASGIPFEPPLANPLMYFPELFQREDTLMFMASHTAELSTGSNRTRYDFHINEGIGNNSNAHSWIVGHGSNTLACSIRFPNYDIGIVGGQGVPLTLGSEYRIGALLNPIGCKYIIKRPGDVWMLWFSDNWSVWNPLYFNISSQNGGAVTAQDTDWVGVTRLSTLMGLHAWDNNEPKESFNSVFIEGQTATHPTKAIIEFYLNTLPVSGSMRLHFRKIDTDNYWELEISNDAKTISLNKNVAGVFSNVHSVDITTLLSQPNPPPLQANTPFVLDFRDDQWTSAISAEFAINSTANVEINGTIFEAYDLAGGSIRDVLIRNKILSGATLDAINYVEQRILDNN